MTLNVSQNNFDVQANPDCNADGLVIQGIEPNTGGNGGFDDKSARDDQIQVCTLNDDLNLVSNSGEVQLTWYVNDGNNNGGTKVDICLECKSALRQRVEFDF